MSTWKIVEVSKILSLLLELVDLVHLERDDTTQWSLISPIVLELVDVVHLERDESYTVTIIYEYLKDSGGE